MVVDIHVIPKTQNSYKHSQHYNFKNYLKNQKLFELIFQATLIYYDPIFKSLHHCPWILRGFTVRKAVIIIIISIRVWKCSSDFIFFYLVSKVNIGSFKFNKADEE